eukprot:gene31208-6357_t
MDRGDVDGGDESLVPELSTPNANAKLGDPGPGLLGMCFVTAVPCFATLLIPNDAPTIYATLSTRLPYGPSLSIPVPSTPQLRAPAQADSCPVDVSMYPPLLNLPNEVVMVVLGHLKDPTDMNNFLCCNKTTRAFKDDPLLLFAWIVRLLHVFQPTGRHALHHISILGHESHETICWILISVMGRAVNDLDDSGYAPLHLASDNGHARVVKQLLQATGVDVNIRTQNQRCTPLHLAATYGHHEAVRCLLQGSPTCGKGDANLRDNNRRTALLIATVAGHDKVVLELVNDESVELEAPDCVGNTALHVACREGLVRVVRVLLQAPSNRLDVNTGGQVGRTALHLACMKMHLEVVQALVGVPGINLKATDNNGVSPSELMKLAFVPQKKKEEARRLDALKDSIAKIIEDAE